MQKKTEKLDKLPTANGKSVAQAYLAAMPRQRYLPSARNDVKCRELGNFLRVKCKRIAQTEKKSQNIDRHKVARMLHIGKLS